MYIVFSLGTRVVQGHQDPIRKKRTKALEPVELREGEEVRVKD